MDAEDGSVDPETDGPPQPQGTEDVEDLDLGDGRTVLFDREASEAWIESTVSVALAEMQ